MVKKLSYNLNAVGGMLPLATALASLTCAAQAQSNGTADLSDSSALEEVVVTARKTAENLQKTPLAVSVLSAEALQDKGVSNIGDFIAAPTPLLRVIPYAGASSLPLIGVRGLSTDDPGQASNEAAVGLYVDGIYLSRTQGSQMDLAEIERIEILRGPQGTLFGRNALGGAINVVTKKPTGNLGLDQTLEVGNFSERKAVTHLNLPALAGLKTKLDYVYASRDGVVDNSAAGQWNYGEYRRWAGRVGVLWDAIPNFTAEYAYDRSNDKSAFGYNQRDTDGNQTSLPAEPDRVSRSASPQPLQPGVTTTDGHGLTLTWTATDALTLKSITSYRELHYLSFENYPHFFVFVPLGGTSAASGLINRQQDDQRQFSQELQALGAIDTDDIGKFKYATGLYYFRENVRDVNGNGTVVFNFPDGFNSPATASIVNPYITFGSLFFGAPAAPNWVDNLKANSRAVFAQTSWNPPGLDDKLEVTAGLRYTSDRKSGGQVQANGAPSTLGFELSSNRTDYNLTVNYAFTDDLNAYVRNATGYRGGGVSLRDPQLVPFQPDTSDSWELGLKSEFWGRRGRANFAVYRNDVDNMRTSFSDPASPTTTRLFNAQGTVEIQGLEAELTIAPMRGVAFNATYAYMETSYPRQQNPFAPAVSQAFVLAQAPKHSASLSVDWELAHTSIGTLDLYGDAYFTSKYVSVPQLIDTGDAYNLFNARLTLRDIPLGSHGGSLKASAWVKNLTDEKYQIWEMRWGSGVPITPADSRIVQYGEPRTFGLALTYAY